MPRSVSTLAVAVLAIGAAACSAERTFTSPESAALLAKAPSVSDPLATFWYPRAVTATTDGVFGDDYRVVNDSSTYAPGDCGVGTRIFSTTAGSGSGDATMGTNNPTNRPKACASYPRKITMRYSTEAGVPIIDARPAFVNLRAIATVGSAMAIGDTIQTILAVTLDGTSTNCSAFRWNPVFQGVPNASSYVTVARLDATTYHAWTEPGQRAYCTDNGKTYDIPVDLTVVASKAI